VADQRPRRDAPAPLVHVHGVVRTSSAPRLGRSPGMPGATGGPRVVAVGVGHWMVVSDVPAALYGDASLSAHLQDLEWLGRCTSVHHDALGRAVRSGPVVPLRLFSLFATEARAAAHVRDALPALGLLFDRLDGKVEYGVHASRARAVPHRVNSPAQRGSADNAVNQTSAAHRTRNSESGRHAALVDEALRERLVAVLRRLAVDTRELTVPAQDRRVWLAVTVLVSAAQGPAFVRAVRAFDRELRPAGHVLTLTGPWPPFTFADSAHARA
jgi:hypothetical protein